TLVLSVAAPASAQSLPELPKDLPIGDVMKQMESQLPRLLQMLEIVRQETPALQQALSRVAAQAAVTRPQTPLTGPGGTPGLPSPEQMTEIFKVLSGAVQGMQQAAPDLNRIQQRMQRALAPQKLPAGRWPGAIPA